RTRLVLQHKQLPHASSTWALKKDEPAEERELLWDRLLWQLRNLQADLRDGGFFGGGAAQLADFMVWPWIERLPPLMQHYCLPPRLPDSLGHLSAWSEAIVRDGAGASDSTARLGAHLAFCGLCCLFGCDGVWLQPMVVPPAAENRSKSIFSVLSVIQLDFFRLFISV
uniref:GST C-terminal domain-containing protein n=1 Tax=Macrostomum lignano TaxID=282301 RepID=A0A1I8FI59_9PLAT